MMEKLWGDNYFDTKGKKWKNHNEADDKSTLKRAFVQFIMAPVIQLCKACMNNEVEKVTKMTKSLEITMKADELKLQGKHLMKNVF
jgi:elongation factor 2